MEKSLQFFKFPTIGSLDDGVHKIDGIMYVVKNSEPLGMIYDTKTIVFFFFVNKSKRIINRESLIILTNLKFNNIKLSKQIPRKN